MAEVIKFEFDHPVEVALRFTDPRVFPSQFDGGDDRHMFSTTDGRVMYVTPLTSARIQALHLAQGECFYICKRKNGRLTEFSVTREPIATQPAAARPAPRPAPFKTKLPDRLYAPAQEPAPSPSLEEQLRASIDMVNRRKSGEQGDGTLAVMAPPRRDPHPVSPQDASGSSPQTDPIKKESRMAPAVAEFSARLVLETTALVDCYATVLETANKKHGTLIKSDDIRSLLLSCYINASKSGVRNNAA